MKEIFYHPLFVLIVSFVLQSFAAYCGHFVRKRRVIEHPENTDFPILLSASLTLLALVTSFSFAMAIDRYDQRKNYEAAEANAIGTEHLRAQLLPFPEVANVRKLLIEYTILRIRFYQERDQHQLDQVNVQTTNTQNQLWAAVTETAAAHPTPVIALVLSGMNDVLNSHGHTPAAWWNRIPPGAWEMMILIALSCNFLLGYSRQRGSLSPLLILPIIISISFFSSPIPTVRVEESFV